jgi:hypothetical protein
MADLLRWAGIEMSEAMVFGLGGGLGFQYCTREDSSPTRQIAGRAENIEMAVAERLELKLEEHRTDQLEEGWAGIRDTLDDGAPVMVRCEFAELPYGSSEMTCGDHRLVVVGIDESNDRVRVADPGFEEARTIDGEAFRGAYGSTGREGEQFAWWRLLPGEPRSLDEALQEALEDNADRMRTDQPETRGLFALRKFRDEVADWGGDEEAARSYRCAYESIAGEGTDGAMFRNLYREFLSEATEYLPELSRSQMPVSMSRNADTWSTLATYLQAMARFLETDGEEPAENPRHHLESMAEAAYQFESTFWQRIARLGA